MAETEYIDLTPAGMQTQEGIAKVNKAQSEWDSATHEVANMLNEFFNDGSGALNSDDVHQLKALLGVRVRKQEVFLRAVAGR